MRYGLLVLVLLGQAVAYVPSSFRAQATAGLWTDDYDLLFEPARIPLIKGDRVFTGLSNLVSGQEEQFGAGTSNFYLVGGSTNRLGSFYPGALVDRSQARVPRFTGLVGQYGDSLYGTGRLVFSELLDLDSNGTYDYKRVDVQDAEAWDESSITHFYAGLGYKASSLRVGIGLAHSASDSVQAVPGWNRTYERRDSSLVDGRLMLLQQYDAATRLSQSTMSDRIIANGWYDMEFVRVGLLASFTPQRRTAGWDRRVTSLDDPSPSDPLVDDATRTSLVDTSKMPYSGSSLGATLSVFYVPRPEWESRFYLTGSMLSQTVEEGAGGYSLFTADSATRPGLDSASDLSYYRFSGRTANRSIGASTRQLMTIAEKLKFGLGLGFTTSAWEDSLVDTASSRSYYAHNNGDTIAGREDYRVVRTSSEAWLDRTTGSDKMLTLPVGVEFRPLAPLALRLGVSPRITWRDETVTEQLVAASPEHVRTDYGDGSYSESIGPGEPEPGRSETKSTVTHSTQFSYGLGYSPMDNLQIDLLGFAKLTDMTNWRLSVTFKF